MSSSSRFPDHEEPPVVCCPPVQQSKEVYTHDPVTNKPLLHVKTDTDYFVLRGNACELSSFSFVPTSRETPKERTCFNSDAKERPIKTNFDRTFHVDYDYNGHLHRCDRVHAHARGLEVNEEEKKKSVPTLSNSLYGHYLDRRSEPHERSKHARVQHVQADFYRRQGVMLKVLESPKDY